MSVRDRHRLVKAIFLEACEVEPDARDSFLARACAADPTLRPQVERMLAAELDRPDFLEQSPIPRQGEAGSGDAELPRRIGAFRILRFLGEGGMGQVYEAEQDNPRRLVALKVLKLGYALPKLLERFELEKDVLARLQHPGIAQIFDAGTAQVHGVRQPYFAMELVAGATLTEHAKPLGLKARLELFVLVCDAVQHAHQKGVVHRDLKPANILVTESGQPKILDFGIARAADTDVQLTTIGTDTSQIVGTLPYMSPEQASAPDQIDARSDVYGLGVVLYEIMTGRLPYDLSGVGLPSAVRMICEEEPQRIGTTHRSLRGDLETIASRALAKDKEHRYVSADALAADVRRYLRDEPVEARPPSRIYRFSKFARRNKALVGAVSMLFVALVAVAWFAIVVALREGQRRRDSEQREYRATINAALSEIAVGRVDGGRRWLQRADSRLRDWEWRYARGRLDPGTRQCLGLERPPLYTGFVGESRRPLVIDVADDAFLYESENETWRRVRRDAVPGEKTEKRHPLAISPDALLALSVTEIDIEGRGSRRQAVLWRTTTGETVRRFATDLRKHLNSGSAAVSVGGRYVAVPTHERLLLYAEHAGEPVASFEGSGQACAFDARGRWLAYVRAGAVHFWDVATDREARPPIQVSRATVAEIALNADHTLLATGVGGLIQVWLTSSGELLSTFHAGGAPVYNLVFGGNGAWLAANSNGAVKMWNATTGTLLRTFPAYRRYGARPSFDRSGRLAAVAHSGAHQTSGAVAQGCGLRIWNLAADSLLVLQGHDSYVYPVVISPDGSRIASGDFLGEIRLWDAETSRVIWSRRTREGVPVHALAFDPRGQRLVSATRSGGGQRGRVQVWDAANGTPVAHRRMQSTSVAFSPDGTLLLVGDGRFRARLDVLDGDTLAPRTRLDAFSGVVSFSPSGEFFVTANPGVVVWKTSSMLRACELEHEARVVSVAFSPDGKRLATGNVKGKVAVWDLSTRRRIGLAETGAGQVYAVRFLSERRGATGGRDGVIRIWDVAGEDLAPVTELRGHTDYVYSLALSPDGERLVSGSGDGTVRIWETYPIARRLRAREKKK